MNTPFQYGWQQARENYSRVYRRSHRLLRVTFAFACLLGFSACASGPYTNKSIVKLSDSDIEAISSTCEFLNDGGDVSNDRRCREARYREHLNGKVIRENRQHDLVAGTLNAAGELLDGHISISIDHADDDLDVESDEYGYDEAEEFEEDWSIDDEMDEQSHDENPTGVIQEQGLKERSDTNAAVKPIAKSDTYSRTTLDIQSGYQAKDLPYHILVKQSTYPQTDGFNSPSATNTYISNLAYYSSQEKVKAPPLLTYQPEQDEVIITETKPDDSYRKVFQSRFRRDAKCNSRGNRCNIDLPRNISISSAENYMQRTLGDHGVATCAVEKVRPRGARSFRKEEQVVCRVNTAPIKSSAIRQWFYD